MYKRERWRTYKILYLLLGAITLFYLFQTLHKPEPAPKTVVCLSLVYDRITPEMIKIQTLRTKKEIKKYAKNRGSDIELDELSLLVNRAYALEHKYPVFVSDLTEYSSIDKERDISWKRVLFVSELQRREPQCEWIASLDSQSYLWMHNHEISFYDWFSSSGIHENTLLFDTYHQEKRKRRGFYDWNDQPFWFIIGASGVYQVPKIGNSQVNGDLNQDYADHSVFFVKNDEKGRRMMEDWYFEPNDSPKAEYHSTYQEFYNTNNKELRILNRIIMPRQNRGVMVMSFKDFLMPWGNMIRRDEPKERRKQLMDSIHKLFDIEIEE